MFVLILKYEGKQLVFWDEREQSRGKIAKS
jgi:hypothetical protein